MNAKLQVMGLGARRWATRLHRRSAQIVANASRKYRVAVVVSAISGVTNCGLMRPTKPGAATARPARPLPAHCQQHFDALTALVADETARRRVECRVEEILPKVRALYEARAFARADPAHTGRHLQPR